MAASNFAPAAKYLFFRFVFEYYSPKVHDGPLVFNQVSIPGGSIAWDHALCEEQRGNHVPMGNILRDVGFLKESQLSSWATRTEIKEIQNDLTFSEVKTGIDNTLRAGGHVPNHIIVIVKQFEDAYNFALEHQMKRHCEL
jgi:hypothetical protein